MKMITVTPTIIFYIFLGVLLIGYSVKLWSRYCSKNSVTAKNTLNNTNNHFHKPLELSIEGDFRKIDLHETFHHGGPIQSAFLFKNGVLLPEGGDDTFGFTADKRYFFTILPTQNLADYKLIIYDQIDLQYYSGLIPDIPLALQLKDIGRNSIIDCDISRILSYLKTESFTKIQDFYLPQSKYLTYQDAWILDERLQAQLKPPVNSNVELQFSVRIPDLTLFPYPLTPLEQEIRGELLVNGETSQVLLAIPKFKEFGFPLIWREDGHAFVCRGYAQIYDPPYDYNKNNKLYLWDSHKKWQEIAIQLKHNVYNLAFYGLELSKLTKQYIINECSFYIPHVLREQFEIYQKNHAVSLTLVEEKIYHYTPINTSKDSMILSESLKTGEQIQWINSQKGPLNDVNNSYSNLQYARCRIGDWKLPGYWLLNHKICQNSDFIALVQYSASPYFYYKIAIIDIVNKTISYLEESYFLPVLMYFHDNKLIFQYLAGYYQSNEVLDNIAQREKNTPPDITPPKKNRQIRDFLTCNFNLNRKAYYKLLKAEQRDKIWLTTELFGN